MIESGVFITREDLDALCEEHVKSYSTEEWRKHISVWYLPLVFSKEIKTGQF